MEVRKYFELNDNENKPIITAKTVLLGNLYLQRIYSKRKKKNNHDLSFYLKVGKEQQIKFKERKKEGIINERVKFSAVENIKSA